jgi:hypothetical protein
MMWLNLLNTYHLIPMQYTQHRQHNHTHTDTHKNASHAKCIHACTHPYLIIHGRIVHTAQHALCELEPRALHVLHQDDRVLEAGAL